MSYLGMLSLVCLAFLLSLLSCNWQSKQSIEEIRSAPYVKAVYPSSDTLPENILRFYVEFSEPMKAVNNLENIIIINEFGEEVQGAIFNNVYELWDNSQRQLTLIMDPARVKTGLNANEDLGRALNPGHRYSLQIEYAENINGVVMQEPFTKSFYVTKQDVSSPDISLWSVNTPTRMTKEPIEIQFPEPLDRMSLLYRIKLVDNFGDIITGKVTLDDSEKLYKFYPDLPWTQGQLKILINNRIEDPSGNNLNGLFDHKMGSLKHHTEDGQSEIVVYI